MAKSAARIAGELLDAVEDGLEELRVHDFEDDQAALDDERTNELYAEFCEDFERLETVLTKTYGSPQRSGQEEDNLIPVNGVIRFSMWQVNYKVLFVVVSHEDRGCPIVLLLGTAAAPKKNKAAQRKGK